ncbi:regulation of response to stimulus [Branchiostoma belcheri]|nr:regulation of response to stimulus [Branchiostoma belcheri]
MALFNSLLLWKLKNNEIDMHEFSQSVAPTRRKDTASCEDGDDSVTFYAAAAEVNLPQTSTAGAEPFVYNTEKTLASENGKLESVSATNWADQEQTVYEITNILDRPDTGIYPTSDSLRAAYTELKL